MAVKLYLRVRWEGRSFLILFLSAPEERLPHCSHAEDQGKGPKQSPSDACPPAARALSKVTEPPAWYQRCFLCQLGVGYTLVLPGRVVGPGGRGAACGREAQQALLSLLSCLHSEKQTS